MNREKKKRLTTAMTKKLNNDNKEVENLPFNKAQIQEFMYHQEALFQNNKKQIKQEIRKKLEESINIAKIKFSKPQINEFKQLFTKFDINGDQTISIDEMMLIMKNIGLKIERKLVLDVMKNIDVDNNNAIDFDEFLCLMSKLFDDQNEEMELREAFHLFDINSDSYITYEDLKEFFKQNNLNDQNSEHLINDIIRYTDINKDSKIDFEEFSNMYKITKKVLEQISPIEQIRKTQKDKFNRLLDMYLK